MNIFEKRTAFVAATTVASILGTVGVAEACHSEVITDCYDGSRNTLVIEFEGMRALPLGDVSYEINDVKTPVADPARKDSYSYGFNLLPGTYKVETSIAADWNRDHVIEPNEVTPTSQTVEIKACPAPETTPTTAAPTTTEAATTTTAAPTTSEVPTTEAPATTAATTTTEAPATTEAPTTSATTTTSSTPATTATTTTESAGGLVVVPTVPIEPPVTFWPDKTLPNTLPGFPDDSTPTSEITTNSILPRTGEPAEVKVRFGAITLLAGIALMRLARRPGRAAK